MSEHAQPSSHIDSVGKMGWLSDKACLSQSPADDDLRAIDVLSAFDRGGEYRANSGRQAIRPGRRRSSHPGGPRAVPRVGTLHRMAVDGQLGHAGVDHGSRLLGRPLQGESFGDREFRSGPLLKWKRTMCEVLTVST
jgi:hypothetical protein